MSAPTPPRMGARAEAVIGLTDRISARVAHISPVLPPDVRRFAQLGSYLHDAGPRAIAEFLVELGHDQACTAGILAQAARWRDMMPAGRPALVLRRYAGGKQFPQHLAEVPA